MDKATINLDDKEKSSNQSIFPFGLQRTSVFGLKCLSSHLSSHIILESSSEYLTQFQRISRLGLRIKPSYLFLSS